MRREAYAAGAPRQLREGIRHTGSGATARAGEERAREKGEGPRQPFRTGADAGAALPLLALAGNPNCGKTTLFNLLTGGSQYVGNWPGVTVEKKEGTLIYHAPPQRWTVVDLPGCYSLWAYTQEEGVAGRYLLAFEGTVVNILDGTNLQRNLYLTLQLLELGVPMVAAVNMMDEVEADGGSIRCQSLAEGLGIPVIPISARREQNTQALLQAALSAGRGGGPNPPAAGRLPPAALRRKPAAKDGSRTEGTLPAGRPVYETWLEEGCRQVEAVIGPAARQLRLGSRIRYCSLALLEGDQELPGYLGLTPDEREQIGRIRRETAGKSPTQDPDNMVSQQRYRYIEQLAGRSTTPGRSARGLTLSDRVDRVVTHRIWGIPLFFALLGLMFYLAFGPVGSGLQQLLDQAVNRDLAQGVGWLLARIQAPEWCRGLLCDGVIRGVGSVICFLPQLAILFAFLSVLEDSGYLARGAFMLDRGLRRLGLNGKAFIPLLLGLGCSTPAIMAARTMENPEERKLTALLVPYISCGARLPIYLLFAGCFFPERQGLAVGALYLLGLAAAAFMGVVLKNTIFHGRVSTFLMELPPYRFPSLPAVWRHLWERCRGFLIKAGTVIFAMSVLVWMLQNLDLHLEMAARMEDSIFAWIGSSLSPLFAPLGFGFWQAAAAVLAGLVSKEAVVATLQMAYGGSMLALTADFSTASAASFMVFTLLYLPCTAAFATLKTELGSWKAAAAAGLLQTGFAWLASFAAWQLAYYFL